MKVAKQKHTKVKVKKIKNKLLIGFDKSNLILAAGALLAFLIFFAIFIFIFGYKSGISSKSIDVNKNVEDAQIVENIQPPLVPDEPNIPKESMESFLFSSAGMSSFGDHFSSAAWLNEQATTMFLDINTTALTFPPRYDLFKERDCTANNYFCSAQPVDNSRACINDKCLETEGKNIFFDNRRLNLPLEITNQNVAKISVYTLEKTWFVGAIFVSDGQEEVALWKFDGSDFYPLLGPRAKLRGQTKFGKGNGGLGLGGTEKDFLLVYAGYEGLAFHFKDDVVQDVSNFFGLRVVDGGFAPQIIRAQDRNGIFWYIFGLREKQPKFLKLWQNGTEKIEGIIDLSTIFSEKNIIVQNRNFSFENKNDKRSLLFVAGEKNEQKLSIWRFTDLGFDNSQDFLVLSKNLNQGSQTVSSAIIQDLGLNLGLDQENSSDFFKRANLQLSNNGLDWLGTSVKQELKFPDQQGRKLLWRIKFIKRNSADYSPFLDHLNNLEYLLK